MLENRPFELSERSARLETELAVEQLARASVEVERVCLSARAIERQHQLATQTLLQRVVAHELLELGHELCAGAESEVCLDPFHQRGQSKLVETPDLPLHELERGQVEEHRPAPERQRSAQLCGCRRGIAVGHGCASFGE